MKYNLSEITEVIQNRRSIYPEDYSDRIVHREIIEDLLNNAIWAPTHGMVQPWRFKVYTGTAVKTLGDQLISLYKRTTPEEKLSQKKVDKMKARFSSVTALAVICMSNGGDERFPVVENTNAVACAVQNMYLTATAYGLGSYWSSPKFIYTDEMKQLLGLNEKDMCLGLFYLGYPTIDWPKSHRKPIEYVTEWHEE